MTKWKLVPVEPTPEMIKEAFIQMATSCSKVDDEYRAMLEAAPQPEPLSDERIREIWIEHGLDEEDVEGFARSIEREILGIEQEQSE